MKKLLISNVLVFLMTLALIFGFQLGTTQAQGNSFQNVYPLYMNSGYVVFFDSNNGMYYLYDSDLNKCVMQKQITELGKPAETILNEINQKPVGVY